MPELRIFAIATIDTGEIIGVLVFFLYGLFWLFRRLANAKEQQKRRAVGESAGPEQEKAEKEDVYVANEEKVLQFLETLGAKPSPERKPEPRPAQYPGRQPQRPERPEPARRMPQPVERRVRPPQEPPPIARRVLASNGREPYEFGAETSAMQPAPARRREEALKAAPEAEVAPPPTVGERLALPRLSQLKRAVVLSEILQRKRGPHRLVKPQ